MTELREEVLAEGIRIFLGDCRDVLPLIGRVDAVVTDPPYSKQVHEGARGKGATTGGKHILVDFDSFDDGDFVSVMRNLVSASNRWVVATCVTRHAVAAEIAGLPVVRLGVWTKVDPAPQFTGDRPGTGWEMVIILHREGKKRWNGGGRSAVWRTKIVKNDGEHPTQKPTELINEFVSLFSDSDETILDPYMGSGTTGVACVNLGRKFIGVEIEERYYDIARRRISEALRQPRLALEEPKPMVQTSLLDAAP